LAKKHLSPIAIIYSETSLNCTLSGQDKMGYYFKGVIDTCIGISIFGTTCHMQYTGDSEI